MFYYDLLIIIYTVRIKYEHEDNCFDRVLPGYRQDVNIPDARIVVEQGILIKYIKYIEILKNILKYASQKLSNFTLYECNYF